MVYALLAPEAITAWALRQRMTAKGIADDYNAKMAALGKSVHTENPRSILDIIRGLFQNSPLPPELEEREISRWTLTHGFFLQMGGFILCKNGRPVQSLTTGFWNAKETRLDWNIENGTVDPPQITEEEIKDRSKGDAISKTFVILQTTWFVAQCIVRWSQHLLVTELEVITLGFALLNGITYALWWNKPQNVGQPVRLEVKIRKKQSRDRPTAPKQHEDQRERWGYKSGPIIDPYPSARLPRVNEEEEAMHLAMQHSLQPGAIDTVYRTEFHPPSTNAAQNHKNVQGVSVGWQIPHPWRPNPMPGAQIPNLQYIRPIPMPVIQRPNFGNTRPMEHVDEHLLSVNRAEEGMHLAWQQSLPQASTKPAEEYKNMVVSQYTQLEHTAHHDVDEKWSWFHLLLLPLGYIAALLRPFAKVVDRYAASIPAGALRVPMLYSGSADSAKILRTTSAIGVLFGLVHLATSWFVEFPSVQTARLWRAAAIVITVQPMFIAFYQLTRRSTSGRLRNAFKALMIGGLPLYIVGRIILLTLSLTSLRSLPPGAFQTIEWTVFIPHL